jgi:hypothetical protein
MIIKNRNSNRRYSPAIENIEINITLFAVTIRDNFNTNAKKMQNTDNVRANELIFVAPKRIGGKKIIHAKAKKYLFFIIAFFSKERTSTKTEKNKMTDCRILEIITHCGVLTILSIKSK